jgi:uncharacterized protein
MFTRARAFLLAFPIVLTTSLAASAAPQVKDDAGFFSESAIRKANEGIREIERRFHKDLLIETFLTPPDDEANKVRQMDKAERERFFNEWALRRARDEGVNGIYVLICKAPAHLEVEVGNKTRQQAFTMANRDHLRDLLAERFRAKEYDRGLLEAVDYVRDSIEKNESGHASGRAEVPPAAPGGGAPPAGAQPGGLSWLFWAALIGLGVVLVLAILFRVILGAFNQRAPGYGPGVPGGGSGYGPSPGYGPGPGYGYGGGGGGGFFSSMIGSLFGSAAGNWAYDRFFRGEQQPQGGLPTSSGPARDTFPEPEERDTDYSGAGADFGDSSGPAESSGAGPDLGSGSFFGGGDSGDGGDSGGGGDFAGGGDSGGGGGADF